jgi:hypothetical protein
MSRALLVETLEGRCLFSVNPAATSYLPNDYSGDLPSAAVVSASPNAQGAHEDTSWNSASRASPVSGGQSDQFDGGDVHRQTDGEGDAGQSISPEHQHDTPVVSGSEGEHDRSSSGDDRPDGQYSPQGLTSSGDDSGERETAPAGSEVNSTSSPPVAHTPHAPPVVQSTIPPTNSHSARPPVEPKTPEEDLSSAETASSQRPSEEQTSTQETLSEPSSSLANSGITPPSQAKTLGNSGAFSVAVESTVGQTSHPAGSDEHGAGQNGPATNTAALNVHDNHHGNEGLLASPAIAPGHTGPTVELAAVVSSVDQPFDASVTASLPSAFAEAALPACAMLLTDILPMDFSAIESSIRAFFDQMEGVGSNFNESRLDLLFSTGFLVAATAVALEVARRQMKPETPVFALGREGIPYSDCV